MSKNIYIILIVLLAACSASKQNTAPDRAAQVDSLDNKNKAINHFVNGSVLELKGKYTEAILEYQESLQYDPQPGVYFALGKNYLRLKKIAPALRYTKKAVAQSPEELEYKFLLAEIFAVSHQNDSAAAVYASIIEQDSSQFNAYYRLGEILEPEKPLQAMEVYNSLLEKSGPEWSVLVKIADLNERMGNVEKTIETMENLLKIDPSNLNLNKVLIESYLKTNRLEKAEKSLNETLTLYPTDLDLLRYHAELLARSGMWHESADEFENIMGNPKISLEEKLRVGALFFQQAQQDSSFDVDIDKIFRKANSDSTAWQLKAFLGEVALAQGDTARAIEHFRASAHFAKWNSQLWTRLGLLLFDSGKYDKVIDEFEQAVQNFPDEFVINVVLGLSYSQTNDNAQAEKYLKKSVDLNPNDLTALSALGFTLNQLNRNKDALVYLNRALELDPDNIQVLGLLGLIYNAKKEWQLSDKYYQHALELDPENIVLLNNYAYSLSQRGIRLTEALEMVSKAVEAEPDNSAYLDTMGWVHYQLGNYTLAKEYIEKAVGLDNNSADQYEHLGDVLFKLGQPDEAKKYWRKALEIEPKNESLILKIEKGEL